MGSEHFPDENEYDAFLSSHGGSANAYTEMVSTHAFQEVLGTPRRQTQCASMDCGP